MSFEAFRQSLSQGKRNEKTFRDRPCVRMRASQGSSFASRADSFDSCEDDFNPDDLMTEFVCEKQRLEYLEEVVPAFHRQDEEPYSSVVNLIRSIFHVPIVLVSLVYDEFQWFKAGVGLGQNQTPRCISFCVHTFLSELPEVLCVENALEDPRFSKNLFVTGPPNIRFYCGAPLVTQDYVRLGALCIIDDRPRSIDSNAMQMLVTIAELTVRELLKIDVGKKAYQKRVLETRRPAITRIPAAARAQASRELWFEHGLDEGVLFVDVSTHIWNVLWSSVTWTQITETLPLEQQSLWRLICPVNDESEAQVHNKVLRLLETGKPNGGFMAKVKNDMKIGHNTDASNETSTYLLCKVYLLDKKISLAADIIRLPNVEHALAPTMPLDVMKGPLVVIRATLAGPEQVTAEARKACPPRVIKQVRQYVQRAENFKKGQGAAQIGSW
mmetsp:Transcript_132271/g.233199  ORF Transcript_132271/g.233199 Transcript_132271/m.233199 type:complete len:441 (+) Transcript_132271:58-1380(+)